MAVDKVRLDQDNTLSASGMARRDSKIFEIGSARAGNDGIGGNARLRRRVPYHHFGMRSLLKTLMSLMYADD